MECHGLLTSAGSTLLRSRTPKFLRSFATAAASVMSTLMIELRDFTLDDAGSLVENGNNPKVARFLREVFPSPYTMDDANWWVSEGYKLGDSRNVAVDFEGQCIGGAGLQFQQNENQYSCELGYWLGEPHWGKGIATCVVAKLKKLAFSEHEVKTLTHEAT